jgi:hypothetical protein
VTTFELEIPEVDDDVQPTALSPPAWSQWSAPALAAALAVVGAVAGWRGVDLPAQVYRVTMFHRTGLSLWDSQWYGGHWALDYSVLFPPVAGTLGLTVTAVLSASSAALAFDRLVVRHFGAAARVGSLLFAVGTMEQLAIGQLAFLMGEAFALGALCAGARRRWPLAVFLAVVCSLSSPLAGAFLALAALAWAIGSVASERRGAIGVLVGAGIPIAVVAVTFSRQGRFPFPFGDLVFELPGAVVMWLVAPRRDRALRAGAALFVAATAASFLLRTPVGGNVGRLGECVAIPLGACVLWPRRRWLFIVLALPMAVWQWTPAWASITKHDSAQPSVHRAYYAPLLAFLAGHPDPAGRVEIVPTKFHWEAAYAAPTVPLARGWERQLDIAANPLFYGSGRLDATSYRAWLYASGVRFVALPDAPLDFAASAEARLIEAGVPGLRPVWQNAHWRVFAVEGSTGIVTGRGRLVRMSGGHLRLDVTGPGILILRIPFNGHWSVTRGSACLSSLGGLTVVETSRAGTVDLAVGLATHHPAAC